MILVIGTAGLIANILGLLLFHDHSHGCNHHHDIENLTIVQKGQKHSSRNELLPKHSESDLPLDNIPTKLQISVVEDETLSDTDDQESSPLSGMQNSPPGLSRHEIAPHRTPSTHNHIDLNIQGVFLHILADALGHLGVIISALFIWLTNFSWRFYADPFISLITTAFIFTNTLPLVKRASAILLQGVPAGINIDDVRQSLLKVRRFLICA